MPALYEQFFLFGDSITQDSYNQERGFGFSAALQAAYIRRLDVINRGLSGYNTRQALQVLPSIVPSPEQAKIRFLTISFGTNDASIAGAPNKQHIPLEEFRANLEKIINHPQIVAHNPRIILVAPPPVNEHLWLLRDQASGYSSVTRNAAKTKEYADAVVELGAKLDLPVVNLWRAFMEKVDPQMESWKDGDALPGSLDIRQNDKLAELLYDGLHPNGAGYEIIFREMMKVVEEKWPEQMPAKLGMLLPAWNDAGAWKA